MTRCVINMKKMKSEERKENREGKYLQIAEYRVCRGGSPCPPVNTRYDTDRGMACPVFEEIEN